MCIISCVIRLFDRIRRILLRTRARLDSDIMAELFSNSPRVIRTSGDYVPEPALTGCDCFSFVPATNRSPRVQKTGLSTWQQGISPRVLEVSQWNQEIGDITVSAIVACRPSTSAQAKLRSIMHGERLVGSSSGNEVRGEVEHMVEVENIGSQLGSEYPE